MARCGSVRQIDYQYDAPSRLISAVYSDAPDYAYAYDAAGNLTNNNGVTRTFNAANQMTGDGTSTYEYDNNGNLLKINSANSYTWDRANRLLSFGGISYTYNGDGNRVSQTASSIVTRYLLDTQPGLALVIAQTTGANTERYIHAPRGIHAIENNAGNWSYMLQDGLGSVRGMVDAIGTAAASHNYSPYGQPDSPLSGFAFTGEQRDTTGLQYHRARYYNSALGIFPSLDPFEGMMDRAMSLNGYSWVEGNVVNATDASGTLPEYSAVVEGKTRYSCNCGWVDLTHVNLAFDLAVNLNKVLKNPIVANNNNGLVLIHMALHSLPATHTWVIFRGNNITNKNDVILGMQEAHEKNREALQSLLNEFALVTQGIFDGSFGSKPSGWAEEDLPSNRIGHSWARNNHYQEAARLATLDPLEESCRFVDDSEAVWSFYEENNQFSVATLIFPGWRNSYPRRRNSWLSTLEPDLLNKCTRQMSWPYGNIQPIEGKPLNRNQRVGSHDLIFPAHYQTLSSHNGWLFLTNEDPHWLLVHKAGFNLNKTYEDTIPPRENSALEVKFAIYGPSTQGARSNMYPNVVLNHWMRC